MPPPPAAVSVGPGAVEVRPERSSRRLGPSWPNSAQEPGPSDLLLRCGGALPDRGVRRLRVQAEGPGSGPGWTDRALQLRLMTLPSGRTCPTLKTLTVKGFPMSIADQIAEIASALPPERQQEVLDFVEFLKSREEPVRAEIRRPRVAGLFAGMPYSMAEDFDEPLPDSFWTGANGEAPR